MRSIELCHFAMTLSDLQHRILDHDITQSQVSRKQYKMELQLQCIGQMGSRIMICRLVPLPLTLNDPNPGSKGTLLFDVEYLSNGTG